MELSDTFGEFPLKDFQVHWDSLRCLSSEGFDPEQKMGACVVNAGAFQVAAIVSLLVKSQGGIRVEVLEAEVE